MRVTVLTGAGISADSGVPTFRGSDGLWEGHRVEDVASPEGYELDPDLVHMFYDERRSALRRVEPNAAHRALAMLESFLGDDMLIVTQNVDDLHERAGSQRVHHMHGELRSALCVSCGDRHRWDDGLHHRPACPTCELPHLRPDIVWFGEIPYGMDLIHDRLGMTDLFVSIGTSGNVYPAAGFVRIANMFGAETLELNLEPSLGSSLFQQVRHGPAAEIVPAWVDDLMRHGLLDQRWPSNW